MQNKINIPEYYVSEFNNLFRDVVESNFSYVRIRGEISEIKTATKGQIYLTLKDDDSIISGVIWGSKKEYLQFEPKLGIEVIVTGKITTWSRYKTTYQIDIDKLEIAGEGALLKLIENRKKRLQTQGLFDQKYKKRIPYLPSRLGIITSPTGSVIHDIFNGLKDRFPINIDIWPVAVQGLEAAASIIAALEGFNNSSYEDQPEVIIIARGGGSTEDLMTFNDEGLAKAVFKSNIPIISAIGHETDTTIIDYVSDFRVATPTAAAEFVVPIKKELENTIVNISDRLNKLIQYNFSSKTDNLSYLKRLLKPPEHILKLDIFNLLMQATNSQHGLSASNRKFYWNSLEGFFEPIYYDANINIGLDSPTTTSGDFRLPISEHFYKSFDLLEEKLLNLDIKKIHNNMIFSGSSSKELDIKMKVNKILSNLDSIKNKYLNLDEEVL